MLHEYFMRRIMLYSQVQAIADYRDKLTANQTVAH